MKFETKIINFFAGCLQIPIPAALIALIGELQQAANGGKVLEVEIKIKRKRRRIAVMPVTPGVMLLPAG